MDGVGKAKGVRRKAKDKHRFRLSVGTQNIAKGAEYKSLIVEFTLLLFTLKKLHGG